MPLRGRAITACISRTPFQQALRFPDLTERLRNTVGSRRDILRPMAVMKLADFGDDRVKALLTRHLEGMHANTPPGHVFALDWSGLQKPEISFYALWDGEDLLGFGALKELEPRAGEIKSMRTADAHLRSGVAARILEHIIAEARQRGYTRLSLETGAGPAFEPALNLYRKYGFTEGGAFDVYEKSPFNQFLHLDLVSTQASLLRSAVRADT
jgi:putative acetyltransferase